MRGVFLPYKFIGDTNYLNWGESKSRITKCFDGRDVYIMVEQTRVPIPTS